MKKSGFTLIEMLIYLALVVGIATALIYFTFNLLQGRVKSTLTEEVSHNLRLSTRRIMYEIRQATAISSISSTDLCLTSPSAGRSPTRIYLSSGRLYLGWGGTCGSPSVTYPLTSTDVTITGLNFIDTSVGAAKHIDFTYQISGVKTTSRKEWTYATTASASASLH